MFLCADISSPPPPSRSHGVTCARCACALFVRVRVLFVRVRARARVQVMALGAVRAVWFVGTQACSEALQVHTSRVKSVSGYML